MIGATASNGLLLLAVLACPVGMVAMMFFMGRGMTMKKRDKSSESEENVGSLAEMKAEQARLAEKIDALAGRQLNGQPGAPASERETGELEAGPIR